MSNNIIPALLGAFLVFIAILPSYMVYRYFKNYEEKEKKRTQAIIARMRATPKGIAKLEREE